MPKRVTLKDVATQAGVSYQTVSKVINGKASVAADTEAQIWQAIEQLDYRTNVTARNLRTQASYLIGYSWLSASPEQGNPILDRFLTSLTAAAEAAGYHILLFPSRPDDDPVQTYRELAHTGRVDAFVLSTTNYDDTRIQALLELDFPFVAFGRANSDWDFAYVDVDGRAGVYMATEHLLSQGHERIGLLAWPEDSRVGTSRANGYLTAMSDAAIAVPPQWLERAESKVDAGRQAATRLLDLPVNDRPTAIVAVDDQLAIGAMQAVNQAGLIIGAEVGITGFDDSPGIQHLSPPLTSIRQPIRAVGEQIIELLVQIIQQKQPPTKSIVLSPKLIVRQSSLR